MAEMVGCPPEIAALYMDQYVSSWHVCCTGPVPFGHTGPVYIALNGVLVPTHEEAEAKLWAAVREACDTWGREFDETEWELGCVSITNGN